MNSMCGGPSSADYKLSRMPTRTILSNLLLLTAVALTGSGLLFKEQTTAAAEHLWCELLVFFNRCVALLQSLLG